MIDDQMMAQASCYFAHCEKTSRWGLASSVEHRNPDGSPLTLFSCDSHYNDITSDLRLAGTKYTLFPINGPHMVQPGEGRSGEDYSGLGEAFHEVSYEEALHSLPWYQRLFVNVASVGATVVIGPFLVVYYGYKWVRGRRPGQDN